MEKNTMGAFIAVLRKASGMTQKQLAELLNVSDKAISRWERDEAMPDLTQIPVLAELFHVTADELLRGQRISPDAPASTPERGERRLQYLLHSIRTRHQLLSLIAIFFSCIGILVASILNLHFCTPKDGVWVSCIFYFISFAIQCFAALISDSSLRAEEFALGQLHSCRRIIQNTTFASFALTAIFFSSTLGLLQFMHDRDGRIPLPIWAKPVFFYPINNRNIGFPAPLLFSSVICVFLWFKRSCKESTLKAKLQRRIVAAASTLILLILIVDQFAYWLAANGSIELQLQYFRKWEFFPSIACPSLVLISFAIYYARKPHNE